VIVLQFKPGLRTNLLNSEGGRDWLPDALSGLLAALPHLIR
jgi:hypothetical protein